MARALAPALNDFLKNVLAEEALESFYRSDGRSIKWMAILEPGLGYLVRPSLGKHDTLKVNRMHK